MTRRNVRRCPFGHREVLERLTPELAVRGLIIAIWCKKCESRFAVFTGCPCWWRVPPPADRVHLEVDYELVVVPEVQVEYLGDATKLSGRRKRTGKS